MVKAVFSHVALYGQTAADAPLHPGPVAADFTFNSPVGCCMDRAKRVWVCDTGNDRVLIFDAALKTILYVLEAPQNGANGQAGVHFRMPFHVVQHPKKNRIYITDMGNSRVVVMDCDKQGVHFSHVFGNHDENGGLKLQDPNGITIVRHGDGKYYAHVNDEFFHTPQDKLRNRCVCYTDEGKYVNEFRTVIAPGGERYDLYWPQGLSSDELGNLYLANTGNYQILRIDADAPLYVIAEIGLNHGGVFERAEQLVASAAEAGAAAPAQEQAAK